MFHDRVFYCGRYFLDGQLSITVSFEKYTVVLLGSTAYPAVWPNTPPFYFLRPSTLYFYFVALPIPLVWPNTLRFYFVYLPLYFRRSFSIREFHFYLPIVKVRLLEITNRLTLLAKRSFVLISKQAIPRGLARERVSQRLASQTWTDTRD